MVRLLEAVYQDSALRVDGDLSEWLASVIRDMQECVLSPLLFNFLLEVVVAVALDGCYGTLLGRHMRSIEW